MIQWIKNWWNYFNKKEIEMYEKPTITEEVTEEKIKNYLKNCKGGYTSKHTKEIIGSYISLQVNEKGDTIYTYKNTIYNKK